jgi:hypothetical protein
MRLRGRYLSNFNGRTVVDTRHLLRGVPDLLGRCYIHKVFVGRASCILILTISTQNGCYAAFVAHYTLDNAYMERQRPM